MSLIILRSSIGKLNKPLPHKYSYFVLLAFQQHNYVGTCVELYGVVGSLALYYTYIPILLVLLDISTSYIIIIFINFIHSFKDVDFIVNINSLINTGWCTS